jgi:hypothetical protein
VGQVRLLVGPYMENNLEKNSKINILHNSQYSVKNDDSTKTDDVEACRNDQNKKKSKKHFTRVTKAKKPDSVFCSVSMI